MFSEETTKVIGYFIQTLEMIIEKQDLIIKKLESVNVAKQSNNGSNEDLSIDINKLINSIGRQRGQVNNVPQSQTVVRDTTSVRAVPGSSLDEVGFGLKKCDSILQTITQ